MDKTRDYHSDYVKLFAIILMGVDHFYKYILFSEPIICLTLTRISAPLFCIIFFHYTFVHREGPKFKRISSIFLVGIITSLIFWSHSARFNILILLTLSSLVFYFIRKLSFYSKLEFKLLFLFGILSLFEFKYFLPIDYSLGSCLFSALFAVRIGEGRIHSWDGIIIFSFPIGLLLSHYLWTIDLYSLLFNIFLFPAAVLFYGRKKINLRHSGVVSFLASHSLSLYFGHLLLFYFISEIQKT